MMTSKCTPSLLSTSSLLVLKRLLLLIAFCCYLTACTASRTFSRYGESTIISADFSHRVINKTGTGAELHVYIEGDGRPWLRRQIVAADPTPRKPLMLRLMDIDENQSLYLGRPCYFQTKDIECNPHWWTQLRYSRRVVDSMNKALDQQLNDEQQLVLIGHSGGGTLAMLMAESRDDVAAIVTLAGNLNVSAWTEHHQYSPLLGSLNPADSLPLARRINQSHYLGTEDETITKAMLEPVIARQRNAQLIEIKGINHNCCWLNKWPKILATLH